MFDNDNRSTIAAHRRRHRMTSTALAALMALAATVPAHATIDNTATAGGTYGGNPVTSPGSTVNVTVSPPSQTLVTTKAGVINANVVGDGDIEAGDTITYTVNVANTGNVTMTGVTPADLGITFNGVASTGTMGSFLPASATLAPGANQDFVVVYTLGAADIANAAAVTDGVSNNANAAGTGPGGASTSNTANELLTIPADPELLVVKSFAITTDNGVAGQADVGDVITYTYTVTNTGNVPITNVTISDTHEGTPIGAGLATNETEVTPATLNDSVDATTDASWDTLGAGGVITFTYAHTVTQTEFDAQ